MTIEELVRLPAEKAVGLIPETPGAGEGPGLQDVPLARYYHSCPQCRALNSGGNVVCRSCSVIFAKWRDRRAVPPAPAPARRQLQLTVPMWLRVAIVVAGAAMISCIQTSSPAEQGSGSTFGCCECSCLSDKQ